MKLYHGTCAKAVERILKNGLTPRKKRPSVWATASNPSAVYLTDAYAIHFGVNACPKGQGRLAIIEIDTSELDEAYLAPDEDFLEQVTRKSPEFFATFDGKTMEERTLWFRRRILRDYRHLWQRSLNGLGNCAYFNRIPPSAFTQVAILSTEHAFCLASDPTITLVNYRLLGPFYRNLTRAVFADYDLFEPDPLNRHEGLAEVDRTGIEVSIL